VIEHLETVQGEIVNAEVMKGLVSTDDERAQWDAQITELNAIYAELELDKADVEQALEEVDLAKQQAAEA
jgi:outer membrane murein-binding lipoprotein Lpp